MINGSKVQIAIILDEFGRVGVNTTSKNLVTNLGMLSVAVKLMEKACASEPSSILVPDA